MGFELSAIYEAFNAAITPKTRTTFNKLPAYVAKNKSLPVSCEGIIQGSEDLVCLMSLRCNVLISIYTKNQKFHKNVHENIRSWLSTMESETHKRIAIWDANILDMEEWVNQWEYLLQGVIVGAPEAISEKLLRRLDDNSKGVDFDNMPSEFVSDAALSETKPATWAAVTIALSPPATEGNPQITLRPAPEGIQLSKYLEAFLIPYKDEAGNTKHITVTIFNAFCSKVQSEIWARAMAATTCDGGLSTLKVYGLEAGKKKVELVPCVTSRLLHSTHPPHPGSHLQSN